MLPWVLMFVYTQIFASAYVHTHSFECHCCSGLKFIMYWRKFPSLSNQCDVTKKIIKLNKCFFGTFVTVKFWSHCCIVIYRCCTALISKRGILDVGWWSEIVIFPRNVRQTFWIMCTYELCTIRSVTCIKKVNNVKLKKKIRKVTNTCNSFSLHMSRAAWLT